MQSVIAEIKVCSRKQDVRMNPKENKLMEIVFIAAVSIDSMNMSVNSREAILLYFIRISYIKLYFIRNQIIKIKMLFLLNFIVEYTFNSL